MNSAEVVDFRLKRDESRLYALLRKWDFRELSHDETLELEGLVLRCLRGEIRLPVGRHSRH